MKNIYVLPTDKPSRLYKLIGELLLDTIADISKDSISINQHIYITSDEEIKEGDWFITTDNNEIHKSDWIKFRFNNGKKIILTTDQDLHQDVQAIDDDFLEWFVKNPSCEFINAYWYKGIEVGHFYKIEIPKEEPRQETLEFMKKGQTIEQASEYYAHNYFDMHETNNYKALKQGFIAGAKWMEERIYNELFEWLSNKGYLSDNLDIIQKEFKQFKDKC